MVVKNPNRLYAFALKHQFVVPAFNIYDIVSLRGILEAAGRSDSPVVVNISLPMYKNLAPLEYFMPFLRHVAEDCAAPVVIGHDYVGTLEECRLAVRLGFQSIAFTGGALPYEENVRQTRRIVEYAHRHGVVAEGELGVLPGVGFAAHSEYTDPRQAEQFVAETGCDLLSVSVGTNHGGIKPDAPVAIQHELLQSICRAVAPTPLVLHGAASRPQALAGEVNRYGGEVPPLAMAAESDVARVRLNGVAKAYMDMDNWLAVTLAMRRYFAQNAAQFNPAQYMGESEEAMRVMARHKMEQVTMSAGFGQAFLQAPQ